MSNWKELEQQYYMKTFSRMPIVLVRGEGARVWDENGKCYLDMVAGLAVNVLGHSHPAVVEAITRQARQLIHTSNLYYTIPQLQLAKLLVDNTPADRVFFANSGAEANEGAIKLARKYGRQNRDGAYEIISTQGSFHGRTLATIALTGQAKFQKPFEPMPAGFKNVPFDDLEAVKRATDERTCAVMLECIQGESGVHLASREYLQGLRAWCDQNNLLLMIDEIQTGLGRTGRFLACEHYGVEPDIFTLAKGLAGGVPIGAVLAKEKAAVFAPSDHGSTFGGNPLACAAGVATVDYIFDNDLAARAETMGERLLQGLRELQQRFPVVETVRGLGLMAALDLKTESAPQAVQIAIDKGLILNYTGPKTLRLLPPLVVFESEIDEALGTLAEVLGQLPS